MGGLGKHPYYHIKPFRYRFFFLYYETLPNVLRNDNGEQNEDEEERTIQVRSVTEIGTEVDFLKANPFISRAEYLYELSIPYITLMSVDFSHTEYLSKKQIEEYKIEKAEAKANKATDVKELAKKFNIAII